MSNLTQGVREAAFAAGADLVGIAGIDRFQDVPPEHHPLSIYPETRSVIVIGRRIVRGALRGVEEGTQFSGYDLYVYDYLDRYLALTVFETCTFLENNRWEAVPLLNLSPKTPPMGIPVRPGAPAPNVTVDPDETAVRAGLGEIGYCGLVLTPQYGPRQKFQMILTAATLDPDPLLAEPVCDMCMECATTCPLEAISQAEKETVNICGKEMIVGKLNTSRCRRCHNGARPNKYYSTCPADRLAALCARTCVDHLERVGRVADTGQHPFRRREVWTLTPDTEWRLEEGRRIE